jgi:hypothetical protein
VPAVTVGLCSLTGLVIIVAAADGSAVVWLVAPAEGLALALADEEY